MSVHTNNHSDHGNDSRRDVKGSVKIIALYFGTIQKLLKEKNQSITQQDDEKFQATKVAFQIEEYAWIISHTLDHVEVVEISVSPSNPFNVINLNCRVITTTSALLSIATGGSPMMAFLQGSFKIIGDKQILRHYAPILKEAAIILQRDLRRSSAQLDKISNSGTEMLSSLYSVSVIDISYHSPTNPSSFHTVSELTSVYSDVTSVNGGDHSSSVAYYVIEVCDLNLNYAWRLRQRYSQFVKLHEGLTLQKYSLPSLPDRIALFRSQASLVESRKVSLQSYLRELLTRIDSNNMFMRVFLKLSRDVAAKYNDNNNECDDDDDNRSDEDEDDENRFKLQKKSTFNQQNASRNKIENTTNTSRSAHSFTNTNTATVASTTATIKNKTPTTVDTVPKLYDIWMHAYSQPITWHKALTNHTVHILQELNRTRKMLSLVSKSTSTAIDSTSTINSNNNSNNGRSTLLMRVQSSIVSFIVLSMVVLVCTYKHTENVSSNIVATIAFDHTRISVVGILEYIYLFLRFYMTTQLIPLTFSLVLFALLASPTTRYTFIYRILMLILIQSVFEVGHDQLHPFQSNKQMNIFESDEIIKSTHVGIETFYFVISIVFKYLIKNMISVFKSYFSYLYSFLSVLFNGVAIMKFSVLFYSNIISSFIFIGSIFIMSISSLRRVISIYALGFGLIFLYLGLKVICVLFRLSASRQDMLYEYIESIIAPYITTQIRQLRSVFIKFAQYAGARSDVISDQWAAVLSELQDSCPSSDPLYVIQTIENNLNDTFVLLPSTDDTEIKSSTNLDTTNTTNDNVDNKKHTRISIKDVFEEFSVESIASASIGQVHHAVLSTKTLKRLAFKVTLKAPTSINSSTDQSGSPTLADAFEVQRSSLQDSFTHPLFSAHQHSLASNYTTKSNSISTHASYGNLSGDDDDEKIAVVVKVQHEHIRATMLADMNVIKILTRVASWLDKRWVPMRQMIASWDDSLRQELDFHTESVNLTEVGAAMKTSQLGCVLPVAIPGLTFQNMFVMSCLHGFKITDKLALSCLEIDRVALLNRIAHAAAYQLLVAGVFNADIHPGNLMFCLTNLCKPEAISAVNSIDNKTSNRGNVTTLWDNNAVAPGLLDFGMTYRMPVIRRRLYCKLLLGLAEGDLKSASDALLELGYKTTQTHRVPERDAEFFAYMFRDASSNRQSNKKETKEYQTRREEEKKRDEEQGVREKNGRNIDSLPEDFLYVTRVIGLIRGLSAELECECEILTILALHAKAGLID